MGFNALHADAQVTGEPPRTSLPTSANGGDLGGGQLNFQPDLFTGRFTYSVPIVVPPGRQGTQPKLAVTYSSSDGNGWCGVGWKFELGKIERETRNGVPIKWTTNGTPAQYDDAKSFAVDFGGVSGHLVQVSPAGQAPAEYRLAVDKTFLRFLYYNQLSNACWSVVDKGGTQYFFGEGPTNRLDNPSYTGGYGTNTFRWALNRILDPNGNQTSVSYTNDFNQLYPVQLSYNANVNAPGLAATHTVSFVLTNRSDETVSCKCGFDMWNDLLLSQIIIKAGGQNVRRYALNYTSSPSTYRSLLATVTQYGSDDATSLPPLTFTYQVKPFGFGPLQDWGGLNSQGKTNSDWNSLSATDNNGLNYVRLLDMDGDGLPDRVMRNTNAPFNSFVVQRNTGSGFEGNYLWGGFDNQGKTNAIWGSISVSSNKSSLTRTLVDLFDINGDGRPDRVMTNFASGSSWKVQLNTGAPGTNGFAPAIIWGGMTNKNSDIHKESVSPYEAQAQAELMDVNGDGLPDRVLTNLQVQLNTGAGFGPVLTYGGIQSSYYTSQDANSDFTVNSEALWYIADLNGDGLPDFLLDDASNQRVVAYCTSGVSAPGLAWATILGEWTNTYTVFSGLDLIANSIQAVKLIDINGDGLLDRVMTKAGAPYDRFKVQLNTGSGFGPLIDWTNILSEATNSQTWNSVGWINGGQAEVAMVDIDGDGLPDRVMRKLNPPYDSFKVQLNQGPFPDLLCGVDNGVGGKVTVSYLPSTKYDNTDRPWTNSPWASGAKSLLPFPVYTVSSITVDDGFGNLATNAYSYQHGMFDPVWREFRGFNRVAVTDPYGAQTVTHFHQSGGFDDSVNGEFQDQGSFAKKGIPYRVETWGSDGLLYSVALNKVQEYTLNTNGWYFPCVTQTILMDYEGLGAYRATARQFTYDTNTENLVAEADFGEVANVVVNGQTFTDMGNDSVFSQTAYTNIGGILNRPAAVEITSDSAGANRVSESRFAYDGNGNLTGRQAWLDTAGSFITLMSANYDQYGNLHQSTDAAGIQAAYAYDPACQQYPVSETTGSFVTQATYDSRSGQVITATDAKGLVSSNSFDVFFRPTGTFISTNAFGAPTLWKTRTDYTFYTATVFYFLGVPIYDVLSYNSVHTRVNDGVDPVNGHETHTYADGLGRPIETCSEAETGQFRCANTFYDLRGKPFYQSRPRFDSAGYSWPGSAYNGTLLEYDSVGRAFRVTQGVAAMEAFIPPPAILCYVPEGGGGDAGSPVGSSTTAFADGANPWATVVTDSEGKVRKTYRDAHGRTTQVTEVTSGGNLDTTYAYDTLGRLTNVTDAASNSTRLVYDSLGRKTSMIDPDMGAWSYGYDNASRLTAQVDSRTNTIGFYYNDELGRLTEKRIWNMAGALTGTISYTYDASDDPSYTVYKGQLYKVTDLQGYQRTSYDLRGRALKSARFLSLNAMEYVTQATYDDADRVSTLTYPGDAASIQYAYDTGGNLSQVKSLSGAGATEIFYTPGSFNALGQLTGYICGNGVSTAYSYYPNSARLQNVLTSKAGTNYQNLTYTYDTASDLKSVTDAVYAGAASASIDSIVYDDLYRLVSLNSAVRGVKTYGYSAIGNILTNQDFGSGVYQYGAKPHAVTSANGMSYGYDAAGNMTARGAQTLAYDEQDQLVRVTSPTGTASFGYDASGERLWRCGTNGCSIWIGGVYEINNGKVLCHVKAGARRIATFEPQCNSANPLFLYYHTDHLGSASVLTDRPGGRVQNYEYTAYGGEAYKQSDTAFPVSNRFTDQTYDPETGLYYFGSRYYDALLGRFLQPDPTVPRPTRSQSLNRFSYCRNNPLNASDPSGYEDNPSGGGWLGSASDAVASWGENFGRSDAYAQWQGNMTCFEYGVGKLTWNALPFVSSFTAWYTGTDFDGNRLTSSERNFAGFSFGLEVGLLFGGSLLSYVERSGVSLDLGVSRSWSGFDLGGGEGRLSTLSLGGEGGGWMYPKNALLSPMNGEWGGSLRAAEGTTLFSREVGTAGPRATTELLDAMRAQGRTVTIAGEGSEGLRFLNAMDAEASAGGPGHLNILLRENPSRAAAMEEFLHGTQDRLGIIDRLGVQGAESHVTDFMTRHSKLLGLEP